MRYVDRSCVSHSHLPLINPLRNHLSCAAVATAVPTFEGKSNVECIFGVPRRGKVICLHNCVPMEYPIRQYVHRTDYLHCVDMCCDMSGRRFEPLFRSTRLLVEFSIRIHTALTLLRHWLWEHTIQCEFTSHHFGLCCFRKE